jgi:FMN phosphatase YigB (HAD superfamily)
MYKLRTVDVWDTLLRRECHPECIKLATAWHLFLGWSSHLRPIFSDCTLLYKARLKAESTLATQARKEGKDDEYELTNVLAYWTRSVFAETVPRYLPEVLAEFELSVEVSRSYVDPYIEHFLSSCIAEKSLFLSDFYMSSQMLTRLLTAKGLGTLVSGGLSSCDVGLNKRSGRLYRHIHALHAITSNQHIHIGDNNWSDVASPKALGISSLHYLPEAEHKKRIFLEKLFLSRGSLLEHVQQECSSFVKENSKSLPFKKATAMALGAEAAALFVGFTIWIAEQSVIKKLDRIYFFTREGEFFYRLYCSLFPDNSIAGHRLPPADILAVSRLSTFSASMQDISIEEMLRIWRLFKIQSISGLFDTLGLKIDKYAGLLEALGLKHSDIIRDPESNPKLKSLFESPSFVDAARSASNTNRQTLERYLSSKGVCACNRIGIIDIGWRGTIQDNLALILPNVHIHGMYLGLRPFINVQHKNTSKSAFGPDENILKKPSKLFENFAAMELLCNSSLGSVKGYLIKDGSVLPDRIIDLDENIAHEQFARPFQEGILLGAQVWRSFLESHVISSSELRDVSLHAWDSLRRNPSDDLTFAYLNTPQIDLFGYGEVFKRDRFPTLATVCLSLVLRSRRNELTDFIRRVQWSAAIASSKDLGILHKALLLGAFYAANLAKRTILRLRLALNNRPPRSRV